VEINRQAAGEVLALAAETGVKFVRLQVTDFTGSLKNLAITIEELNRALEGRLTFDSAIIEGFSGSREREILLIPDPETFVIFPWRPRDGAVARLICQAADLDGNPYPTCSRTILRKNLDALRERGWWFRIGAEIEFFLFHVGEQGLPTTVTHDQAGYCDLTPVDLGENARRDMVLTLQEMGIKVRSSHHEVSPGQHEIGLGEGEALEMADRITTFKFVVRTVAQRHGLHASFMPRPLAGRRGSGVKLHLTLWREEENLFADGEDPGRFSTTARRFAAGLLAHAPALAAVTNPLVNSYKRLVPDGFHPVLAAWSTDSRATMLRMPAPAGDEPHLLLRSPDPTANSYLALAGILAAGLDGVDSGLELPEPVPGTVDGDLDTLRDAVRTNGLPRHLEAALSAFGTNTVLRGALGDEFCRRYAEFKEQEWLGFLTAVHPWEIDTYLARY